MSRLEIYYGPFHGREIIKSDLTQDEVREMWERLHGRPMEAQTNGDGSIVFKEKE